MSIPERLEMIRERIAGACRRAGRDPGEITLLGATKTQGEEKIRQAFDAGLQIFGENRVQEARDKIQSLSDLPLTWHFIGHLQKNKAGAAIDLFDTIQSVDSSSLARRLEHVAAQKEQTVSVCVEINIGGEVTKSGVSRNQIESLCEEISEYDHLRLKGIMSIPPYHPDPEKVRPYFLELKQLFDRLSSKYRSLKVLSMGMSEDFEAAVEEGSTMVRLGRVLFGERI